MPSGYRQAFPFIQFRAICLLPQPQALADATCCASPSSAQSKLISRAGILESEQVELGGIQHRVQLPGEASSVLSSVATCCQHSSAF
jgi:hypothetical protein